MGVSRTAEFWNKCKKSDPRFAGMEFMTSTPGWQDLFVPYFLHGDAAEFCKRDSLLTVSVEGVMAEGETRDKKHLLWSIPKSVCVKDGLHWRAEVPEDELDDNWEISG